MFSLSLSLSRTLTLTLTEQPPRAKSALPEDGGLGEPAPVHRNAKAGNDPGWAYKAHKLYATEERPRTVNAVDASRQPEPQRTPKESPKVQMERKVAAAEETSDAQLSEMVTAIAEAVLRDE